MVYCDAHFHLVQCGFLPQFSPEAFFYASCTCSHDQEEFLQQEKMIQNISPDGKVRVISAFGLHPQNPDLNNLSFLEDLLKEKRIGAIGEAGFDLFSPEFSSRIHEQEEAWQAQLELCASYNIPLVIHCRKGTDRLFQDIKKLQKIPAAIFHSYAGTFGEAQSFLKRGVNAYFSFGKPLLNGKKSALQCLSSLPLENLLLETDAPYQTLKGEEKTNPNEIALVYKKAAELRSLDEESLCQRLVENFNRAFELSR